MTTSRGDWLTLGILTALTAGAAARGRRGGRAWRNDEVMEEDREVYAALFPVEDGIQDLNEVQLKGLRRNEFLLPDGTKPDQVLVYDLRQIPAFPVRSRAVTTPTPRGPRGFRPNLILKRARDVSDTSMSSAVLALWQEDGDGEYKYFFLPGRDVIDPQPVTWSFE